MRAIVTGGAGFIGSNVVDALLARGDEVHVLDDLSKGKRERVAAGARAARRGHPRTRRRLRRGAAGGRLPPRRPGGRARVGRAARPRRRHERPRHGADPRGGTPPRRAGRLRLDRRRDLRRVRRPARGDAPRRPLAPYGTSKLCGEEYLATWNRLYGTRHVSLRFGNVYGPRQEPHGEAGVVAIFMGLLREGGTPKIYGDGSQTRDYVFVGDVVPRCSRRSAATAASSTSAPASRPRCSSCTRRSSAASGIEREPELARGAARRAAAERPRLVARRARARLAPGAPARRRARARRGAGSCRSERGAGANRDRAVQHAEHISAALPVARRDDRRRRRSPRSSSSRLIGDRRSCTSRHRTTRRATAAATAATRGAAAGGAAPRPASPRCRRIRCGRARACACSC